MLGLVWAVTRRAAVRIERLKALWFGDPLSVDLLVNGFVVVAQFALLGMAIVPAVQAELTPAVGGLRPSFPAELDSAFGPGAWLLLGLLALGLAARLRLATDNEPGGDAPLIGLAVLLVSVALAGAGAFRAELAAASALRWGLAGAFLAGSAVLFFRKPLDRLVGAAGFRLRATSVSTQIGYVLFAIAAAVVLLLTANLTALGLSRLKPSGPAAGSVFAALGYTISFLVPLVLLIVGLAGTAVRERLAGYAFVAGLVWTGTVASGYALLVITGGGALDEMALLRLGMLATGSAAAWALLWQAAERRVPGGRLLDVQATFGLIGVGLLVLGPLGLLFASPAGPLPSQFVEIGRFGWIVLALASWAGLQKVSGPFSAARSR